FRIYKKYRKILEDVVKYMGVLLLGGNKLVIAFFLVSSPPSTSQSDLQGLLLNLVTWVIAIGAAILGGLVTFWLTQRQARRGLVYRIVSDTPILDAQEEIEGKVKILFNKSVL